MGRSNPIDALKATSKTVEQSIKDGFLEIPGFKAEIRSSSFSISRLHNEISAIFKTSPDFDYDKDLSDFGLDKVGHMREEFFCETYIDIKTANSILTSPSYQNEEVKLLNKTLKQVDLKL